MKKFTLIATYNVIRTLQMEVCLKPSDKEIENYLATYKVFETEAIAISETQSFISEMTPILFAQFEQMDNVPIEIRNQYEL